MDRIDHHHLAQLLALMGQEQVLGLAGQLATGLAALVALPAADLPDHLHRLRGGAASLGLAGLAAEIATAETGQGDVAALAGQARGVVSTLAAAIHAASCQR